MTRLTEEQYISYIASKDWILDEARSSATYQIWNHKTNKSRIEFRSYVDAGGDIEVEIHLYS